MKKKIWILLVIFVAILGLAAGPVLAETTPSYDLSWWTVDSGGVTGLTSGIYTLSGTAGQPDAGALSGGSYTLAGGFWHVVVATVEEFLGYLPLILK